MIAAEKRHAEDQIFLHDYSVSLGCKDPRRYGRSAPLLPAARVVRGSSIPVDHTRCLYFDLPRFVATPHPSHCRPARRRPMQPGVPAHGLDAEAATEDARNALQSPAQEESGDDRHPPTQRRGARQSAGRRCGCWCSCSAGDSSISRHWCWGEPPPAACGAGGGPTRYQQSQHEISLNGRVEYARRCRRRLK